MNYLMYECATCEIGVDGTNRATAANGVLLLLLLMFTYACINFNEGDEIRRVVVETVIPVSKQFFVGRVGKKLGEAGSVSDMMLVEYDEFDDYLEMIVQFGVSHSIFVYV